LLLFKSTLLLNCSKHRQALTRLGHQGWRRVYWEGRKFFKLCQTHFSSEGQIFFRGG